MKIQKQHYLPALFLAFAAVTLCACGKPDSGIVQSRRGTGVKAGQLMAQDEAEHIKETEVLAPEVSEEELYVLVKLDMDQKLAVFKKAEGGRQCQYAYDTSTRFSDKYGDSKSMDSFVPGDVVSISVSKHTQQLTRVQQSDQAWVYEDIFNYSFDPGRHALIIGKTKYNCDPKMEIFSGDDVIGFDQLGEDDVLRAVGKGKELISLSVTKGHGYLALSNTGLFEGSFICVGDKIFKEVTKNMQIEAPEGKYLVTVANDGYGGSREIEIKRDQTTALNLDELKGEGPKMCRITFKVSVEGAVLWIDGKKADYSKPVDVRYGVHTIAVEAEGYDTIEEQLVVNSAASEIEIALTEHAKSSSKKEQTSGSAGQNQNGAAGSGTNNNANQGNVNNNMNNNQTNNNNNNNNNNTNNNQSQTDYLTTLYNLLTSINNSNQNNTNNQTNSNNQNSAGSAGSDGSSYDDLRDQ